MIDSIILVLSCGANVALLIAYARTRRQMFWYMHDRDAMREKWLAALGARQQQGSHLHAEYQPKRYRQA